MLINKESAFKISIITSTYNCSKKIVETANSLRLINPENKKKIQWIIIDGNSKDDTKYWINKNIDLVDNIIIEEDDGIYDAWNKGLKVIKGDWIIFLGAGDKLGLGWEKILIKESTEFDLIYGDMKVNSGENSFIKKNKEWDQVKTKIVEEMCLNHPGIAHNKNLFNSKSFDKNYQIISDWIFLSESNINKVKYYEDKIQAEFGLDGISSSFYGQKIILEERRDYLLKVNRTVKYREIIKYKLMKILGEKIYQKLAELYRRY
jgi:glycosyltransferase involved in cell wall biosynthesis